MMGKSFVLFAGLFAVTGCVQQVAIEPRPGCDFTPMLTQAPPADQLLVPLVPGTMTAMPLNSVNITDVGITNKVLVQAVRARRMETGTVEVWSRMVNCTDFPLQVEGRVQFMDKSQAPIEPVSAWRRLHLPPRTTAVYSEKSTETEKAETYLIELREGT